MTGEASRRREDFSDFFVVLLDRSLERPLEEPNVLGHVEQINLARVQELELNIDVDTFPGLCSGDAVNCPWTQTGLSDEHRPGNPSAAVAVARDKSDRYRWVFI